MIFLMNYGRIIEHIFDVKQTMHMLYTENKINLLRIIIRLFLYRAGLSYVHVLLLWTGLFSVSSRRSVPRRYLKDMLSSVFLSTIVWMQDSVIQISFECLLWYFVTTPSHVITYGMIRVLHPYSCPSLFTIVLVHLLWF
ncbi:hypothetical protein PAEPH01_0765 [Pancytospora epiphaga]|nr:hypothetical protein PAEPH01_0765 [Pancytospora epiphaga]